MTDQQLDDILEEYYSGYEKVYKNIPDLVNEIKKLRASRDFHVHRATLIVETVKDMFSKMDVLKDLSHVND